MKGAARLLLLAGAVGIGLLLLRASPRELVLVYDLGDRPPAALEVRVLRDGETLRRAELRPGGARQVRHPLRLPDGQYLLRIRLQGAAADLERPLRVSEDATVVLPLSR